MRRLVSIVEGDGEVTAVPRLLQRIVAEVHPGLPLEIPHPIRIPRSKLLKSGELERAVELAARQSSVDDGILVLLDADVDCPAELAPRLLDRARSQRSDRKIRVVLATMEFEAWFLAAANSLAGKRGLSADLTPPSAPEAIRDAKGWLSRQMSPGRRYSETLDQVALAATMDLHSARSASPSFDKLWRDVAALL